MKGVQLTKLVQELGLHNLTPEIDLAEIWIKTAEINRPALQLTGYLEHFANERVQIIGYVEYTYLMQLSDEERKFKYERFISSKIPCVIFSTMTRPSQDMIDLALKYHVPTFVRLSAGWEFSWHPVFLFMVFWWMYMVKVYLLQARVESVKVKLLWN